MQICWTPFHFKFRQRERKVTTCHLLANISSCTLLRPILILWFFSGQRDIDILFLRNQGFQDNVLTMSPSGHLSGILDVTHSSMVAIGETRTNSTARRSVLACVPQVRVRFNQVRLVYIFVWNIVFLIFIF
jgi:hypothetical protein